MQLYLFAKVKNIEYLQGERIETKKWQGKFLKDFGNRFQL